MRGAYKETFMCIRSDTSNYLWGVTNSFTWHRENWCVAWAFGGL